MLLRNKGNLKKYRVLGDCIERGMCCEMAWPHLVIEEEDVPEIMYRNQKKLEYTGTFFWSIKIVRLHFVSLKYIIGRCHPMTGPLIGQPEPEPRKRHRHLQTKTLFLDAVCILYGPL